MVDRRPLCVSGGVMGSPAKSQSKLKMTPMKTKAVAGVSESGGGSGGGPRDSGGRSSGARAPVAPGASSSARRRSGGCATRWLRAHAEGLLLESSEAGLQPLLLKGSKSEVVSASLIRPVRVKRDPKAPLR